ncbi:MAG: hypothetical protein KF882_02925 [Bacteroidia bacterium]|nr:hypothetical protein [Bacteroidia bacterium]
MSFITKQTDYLNERALRDEAEKEYIRRRERLRILEAKSSLNGTEITEKNILAAKDDSDPIDPPAGSVQEAQMDFAALQASTRSKYEILAAHTLLHKNLVNNLNDKFPVLLLPVRIETRFYLDSSDKYHLKVRFFPDDVHIENHEWLLTPTEAQDRAAYMSIANDMEATEDDKKAAWNTLALAHGSQRAAFILKQSSASEQSEAWVRQAEARTLPDKFVTTFYFKGQYDSDYSFVDEVESALVSDSIKLSLDPNDETQIDLVTNGNNDEIVFGNSLEWMGDFDKAEACGMAIEVELETLNPGLTKTALENGELKLVVLGVKISADAALGKTLLEDLIDDHHYTDLGLSLLKIGQPTHNTSVSDSAFTTHDLGYHRSYHVEVENETFSAASGFEEQTDGERLAQAFGIAPSTLYHIENTTGTDIKKALQFNKMLWRATLGYKLEYGFLDVMSLQSIQQTREFFTKHIAGRGLLPSIRINEQAYGILPASIFSQWTWHATEPDKTFLDDLTHTVQNMSDIVGTYAAGKTPVSQGSSPRQDVISVLGNSPVSTDIYHRFAMSEDYTWNLFSFQNKLSDASTWHSDLQNQASQTMQDLGFPSTPPPRMTRLTHMQAEGKYTGALVQEGKGGQNLPLRPLQGASENYLQWLSVSNYPQILNEDFSNVSASATPPNTLLYKLARKAILEEYRNAAIAFSEAYPHLIQLDRNIPEFTNISDIGGTPPIATLEILFEGWNISTLNIEIVNEGENGYPPEDIEVQIHTSVGTFIAITQVGGTVQCMVTHSGIQNLTIQIVHQSIPVHIQPYTLFPGTNTTLTITVMIPSSGLPTGNIITGGQSFAAIMQQHRNFVINSVPFSGTLYELVDSTLYANATWNISYQECRAVFADMHQWIVSDLETLLKEHLDLGSFRLDAWQHGMVHQRIQKARNTSGYQTGLYLGAYGYIEELKPKTNRQNISGSVGDIPDDIENSVEGGYIHTPSPNHASAAAILKSGYLNKQGGDSKAKEVTLTSERVRLAQKFFAGVRNGQSLGALLGYEFERGLNERHSPTLNLNRFIYDFRKSFSLDEITEDTETEKSFILDGWKLFVATRKESNAAFNYNLDFLSGIPQAEEDAIEAELDRLAETFDAISDVCLAEAVYCLVQNNYEKAGAITDALKSGKLITQELDFLKTPLTGSILTQRYALILDKESIDGIKEEIEGIWGGNITPRLQAEPYLSKLVAQFIPNPESVLCKVQCQPPEGAGYDVSFSLADLGLQPLDIISVFPEELANDTSELARLIRYKVKKQENLPHNTEISVLYNNPLQPGTPVSDPVSFSEALPLIKRIKKLLAASRPLRPEDFIASNSAIPEEAEITYERAEFFVRIEAVRESLENLKTALNNAIVALGILENNFASEINELRDCILEAWAFNIMDAAPIEYATETDTAAKNALLEQGAIAVKALDRKLTDTKELWKNFEDNEYINSDTALRDLQHIAKIIFGDAFACAPLFKFINKPEMQQAWEHRDDLIDELADREMEIEKWFQGLTKVRSNLRELDIVQSLGESLFSLENHREPVQLPFTEDDRWMAIKQDNMDYSHDKTSVVISFGHISPTPSLDHTSWQTGLLIDEWVEVIPAKEEVSGLAFNYDQPNTKAPNCLLYTVTPEETGSWTWAKLLGSVNETFYLAKQRNVSPDELSHSAMGVINKIIDQYNAMYLTANSMHSAELSTGATVVSV